MFRLFIIISFFMVNIFAEVTFKGGDTEQNHKDLEAYQILQPALTILYDSFMDIKELVTKDETLQDTLIEMLGLEKSGYVNRRRRMTGEHSSQIFSLIPYYNQNIAGKTQLDMGIAKWMETDCKNFIEATEGALEIAHKLTGATRVGFNLELGIEFSGSASLKVIELGAGVDQAIGTSYFAYRSDNKKNWMCGYERDYTFGKAKEMAGVVKGRVVDASLEWKLFINGGFEIGWLYAPGISWGGTSYGLGTSVEGSMSFNTGIGSAPADETKQQPKFAKQKQNGKNNRKKFSRNGDHINKDPHSLNPPKPSNIKNKIPTDFSVPVPGKKNGIVGVGDDMYIPKQHNVPYDFSVTIPGQGGIKGLEKNFKKKIKQGMDNKKQLDKSGVDQPKRMSCFHGNPCRNDNNNPYREGYQKETRNVEMCCKPADLDPNVKRTDPRTFTDETYEVTFAYNFRDGYWDKDSNWMIVNETPDNWKWRNTYLHKHMEVPKYRGKSLESDNIDPLRIDPDTGLPLSTRKVTTPEGNDLEFAYNYKMNQWEYSPAYKQKHDEASRIWRLESKEKTKKSSFLPNAGDTRYQKGGKLELSPPTRPGKEEKFIIDDDNNPLRLGFDGAPSSTRTMNPVGGGEPVEFAFNWKRKKWEYSPAYKDKHNKAIFGDDWRSKPDSFLPNAGNPKTCCGKTLDPPPEPDAYTIEMKPAPPAPIGSSIGARNSAHRIETVKELKPAAIQPSSVDTSVNKAIKEEPQKKEIVTRTKKDPEKTDATAMDVATTALDILDWISADVDVNLFFTLEVGYAGPDLATPGKSSNAMQNDCGTGPTIFGIEEFGSGGCCTAQGLVETGCASNKAPAPSFSPWYGSFGNLGWLIQPCMMCRLNDLEDQFGPYQYKMMYMGLGVGLAMPTKRLLKAIVATAGAWFVEPTAFPSLSFAVSVNNYLTNGFTHIDVLESSQHTVNGKCIWPRIPKTPEWANQLPSECGSCPLGTEEPVTSDTIKCGGTVGQTWSQIADEQACATKAGQGTKMLLIRHGHSCPYNKIVSCESFIPRLADDPCSDLHRKQLFLEDSNPFSSAEQCAEACASEQDCEFFTYGTWGNGDTKRCFMETGGTTCLSGWESMPVQKKCKHSCCHIDGEEVNPKTSRSLCAMDPYYVTKGDRFEIEITLPEWKSVCNAVLAQGSNSLAEDIHLCEKIHDGGKYFRLSDRWDTCKADCCYNRRPIGTVGHEATVPLIVDGTPRCGDHKDIKGVQQTGFLKKGDNIEHKNTDQDLPLGTELSYYQILPKFEHFEYDASSKTCSGIDRRHSTTCGDNFGVALIYGGREFVHGWTLTTTDDVYTPEECGTELLKKALLGTPTRFGDISYGDYPYDIYFQFGAKVQEGFYVQGTAKFKCKGFFIDLQEVWNYERDHHEARNDQRPTRHLTKESNEWNIYSFLRTPKNFGEISEVGFSNTTCTECPNGKYRGWADQNDGFSTGKRCKLCPKGWHGKPDYIVANTRCNIVHEGHELQESGTRMDCARRCSNRRETVKEFSRGACGLNGTDWTSLSHSEVDLEECEKLCRDTADCKFYTHNPTPNLQVHDMCYQVKTTTIACSDTPSGKGWEFNIGQNRESGGFCESTSHCRPDEYCKERERDGIVLDKKCYRKLENGMVTLSASWCLSGLVEFGDCVECVIWANGTDTCHESHVPLINPYYPEEYKLMCVHGVCKTWDFVERKKTGDSTTCQVACCYPTGEAAPLGTDQEYCREDSCPTLLTSDTCKANPDSFLKLGTYTGGGEKNVPKHGTITEQCGWGCCDDKGGDAGWTYTCPAAYGGSDNDYNVIGKGEIFYNVHSGKCFWGCCWKHSGNDAGECPARNIRDWFPKKCKCTTSTSTNGNMWIGMFDSKAKENWIEHGEEYWGTVSQDLLGNDLTCAWGCCYENGGKMVPWNKHCKTAAPVCGTLGCIDDHPGYSENETVSGGNIYKKCLYGCCIANTGATTPMDVRCVDIYSSCLEEDNEYDCERKIPLVTGHNPNGKGRKLKCEWVNDPPKCVPKKELDNDQHELHFHMQYAERGQKTEEREMCNGVSTFTFSDFAEDTNSRTHCKEWKDAEKKPLNNPPTGFLTYMLGAGCDWYNFSPVTGHCEHVSQADMKVCIERVSAGYSSLDFDVNYNLYRNHYQKKDELETTDYRLMSTNERTECTQCVPGKYQDVPGASTCKYCPQGYYIFEYGADKCDRITDGTGYTDMIGQWWNFSDICLAGKYIPRTYEFGWYGECDGTISDGKEILMYDGKESVPPLCDTGTYLESGQCKTCPGGRYQGQSGYNLPSCKTCPSGTYSTAGAALCETCAFGQYQAQSGQSSCKTCPSGTYSTAGAALCETCAGGQYQAQSGQSSCKTCIIGKYSTAGQSSCKTCASGTYSTVGASSCPYSATTCPVGTYASGVASCDACASGRYNAQSGQSSCETCPSGTYSSVGASSCPYSATTCPVGTYASGAASCDTCVSGTFSTAGAASCETCVSGKFSTAGAASCDTCVSGKFSTAGAASCETCAGGKFSTAGAASCETCPSGKFSRGVGASSCPYSATTCPAGTYANVTTTVCDLCVSGKFSTAGAASCDTCVSGKFSPAGAASCEACPSGKFGTHSTTGAAASCESCAFGQYQAQSGQSYCQTCASGTYSSVGASSCFVDLKIRTSGQCGDSGGGWGKITSAAACGAGAAALGWGDTTAYTRSSSSYPSGCYLISSGLRFNTRNTNYACRSHKKCLCTLTCPPGTYQDQSGQSSCKTCASGQYQDQSGQSSCKTCAIGKYNDQTNQTSCKSCTGGKFSDVGASSCLLNATTCPVGTYKSGTASVCDVCGTGQYNDQTGQTSDVACKSCTGGTYSTVGASSCPLNVNTCPVGTSASDTATACASCGTGQYQDQSGQTSCKTCAGGKYQAQQGQTSCTTCASGTYSTVGASSCPYSATTCPVGTYPNDAASCDTCASGKFSTAGKASCLTCPAGTYANDAASCDTCDSGKFSTAGAVSCETCAGGQYQAQRGKSSCLTCPAGTHANDAASCETCPSGKFSTAGAASCETCAGGQYQKESGQSSCKTCSKGKYSTAGHSYCKTCASGRYNNHVGQSSCEACSSGRYSTAGKSYCQYGETWNNNLGEYYVVCPVGTYASGTASVCDPCGAGKYSNQNLQTSDVACKSCTSGKFSDVGASSCPYSATTCPVGAYASGTATVCDLCGAGKYNDQTNQTSAVACKSCATGEYQNEEGKASCNNDCVSPMVLTLNARCIDNRLYKERTSGQCGDGDWGKISSAAACGAAAVALGWGDTTTPVSSSDYPPGCFYHSNGNLYFNTQNTNDACSSDDKCLCTATCPAGKYQDQEGQPYCKTCASDTYSTVGASSCPYSATTCPVGTYKSETATVCDLCGTGKYNDQTNQTSAVACKSCAAGEYQDEEGKASCKNDCVGIITSDASRCINNRVYKERTSGQCGDSGDGWSKITSAAECGAGAAAVGWADTTAESRSDPWDRPPGCYINILHKASSDLDRNLYFNNYAFPNYNCRSYRKCLCTMTCPPGTYQDETGQSFCKTCAKGEYQDQSGQQDCKTCPSGTFSNTNGASSCPYSEHTCPVGTYASGTPTVCASCGAGKYNDQTSQTSESVACKSCATGEYQNEEGKASCNNNCVTPMVLTPDARCIDDSAKNGRIQQCADACWNQRETRVGGFKVHNPEEAGGKCFCETEDKNCQRITATGANQKMGYYRYNFLDKKPLLYKENTRCLKPDLNPVRKTSGQCTHKIPSRNECEKAAMRLGISDITAFILTGVRVLDFPQGCVIKDGELYFSHSSSPVVCGNDGIDCICDFPVKGYEWDEPSVIDLKDCMEKTSANAAAEYFQYNNRLNICRVLRTMDACEFEGTVQDNDWNLYMVPGVQDTTCLDCPMGQYSPNPNSWACINCPIGYFLMYPGAAECDKCDTGQYQDEIGKHSCKECIAGKYNDVRGSGHQSDCKQCTLGLVAKNTGTSSCSGCPFVHESTENPTECQLCPKGYYQPLSWLNDTSISYKQLLSNQRHHVRMIKAVDNDRRCVEPGAIDVDDINSCISAVQEHLALREQKILKDPTCIISKDSDLDTIKKCTDTTLLEDKCCYVGDFNDLKEPFVCPSGSRKLRYYTGNLKSSDIVQLEEWWGVSTPEILPKLTHIQYCQWKKELESSDGSGVGCLDTPPTNSEIRSVINRILNESRTTIALCQPKVTIDRTHGIYQSVEKGVGNLPQLTDAILKLSNYLFSINEECYSCGDSLQTQLGATDGTYCDDFYTYKNEKKQKADDTVLAIKNKLCHNSLYYDMQRFEVNERHPYSIDCSACQVINGVIEGQTCNFACTMIELITQAYSINAPWALTEQLRGIQNNARKAPAIMEYYTLKKRTYREYTQRHLDKWKEVVPNMKLPESQISKLKTMRQAIITAADNLDIVAYTYSTNQPARCQFTDKGVITFNPTLTNMPENDGRWAALPASTSVVCDLAPRSNGLKCKRCGGGKYSIEQSDYPSPEGSTDKYYTKCETCEAGKINTDDDLADECYSCPHYPWYEAVAPTATRDRVCATEADSPCNNAQFHNGTACQSKVCECTNGVAAAGESCAVHYSKQCVSCDSGYYLKDKECVARTLACNGDMYEAVAPTATRDRLCAPMLKHCNNAQFHNGTVCQSKQCTCPNGDAAAGAACAVHGTEQCVSCEHGYYLKMMPTTVTGVLKDWTASYLLGKCLALTSCSTTTQYELVPPTTTTDRVCSDKTIYYRRFHGSQLCDGCEHKPCSNTNSGCDNAQCVLIDVPIGRWGDTITEKACMDFGRYFQEQCKSKCTNPITYATKYCQDCLSEYSISRCVCPHGVAAAGDICTKHNTEQCLSCDSGHYMTSNNRCEELSTCSQDTYEAVPNRTGVLVSTNDAATEYKVPTVRRPTDRLCAPILGNCNNAQFHNGTVCQSKQCICQNGDAAAGAACAVHGTEQCVSCEHGFLLKGFECVPYVSSCSTRDMSPHGTTQCWGACVPGTGLSVRKTWPFDVQSDERKFYGKNVDNMGDMKISVLHWRKCEGCVPGRYQDEDATGVTCQQCASGKFASHAGTFVCTDCPAGYHSNTHRTSCDQCEVGQYNSLTTQPKCTECGTGKWNNRTGSVPETDCTHCAAGTFNPYTGSVSIDACENCPKGQYNSLTTQNKCTECGTGKWNNRTGSVPETDCTHCAAGKSNPYTGSVSIGVCKNCPTGEFAPIEAWPLHKPKKKRYNIAYNGPIESFESYSAIWGPNKFNIHTKKYNHNVEYNSPMLNEFGYELHANETSGCAKCRPGTYQDQFGTTRCKLCDAGQYTRYMGTTTGCKVCPVGKYHIYNTSVPLIGPNSIGWYRYSHEPSLHNAGDMKYRVVSPYPQGVLRVQGDCTSCPTGFFQNVTEQTGCQQCAAGTYSYPHVSHPESYPPWTYFPSELEKLQNGIAWFLDMGIYRTYPGTTTLYMGEAPTECKPCTVGTAGNGSTEYSRFPYRTAPPTYVECPYCPLGKYSDQVGAGNCKDCPAGKFGYDFTKLLTDHGHIYTTIEYCSDCPHGYATTQPGQSKCVDCSTNNRIAPRAGSTECQTCNAGRYFLKGTTDANSCRICPWGKYTPTAGLDKCLICDQAKNFYYGVRSCVSKDQCLQAAFGYFSHRPCTCGDGGILTSQDQDQACYWDSGHTIGHYIIKNISECTNIDGSERNGLCKCGNQICSRDLSTGSSQVGGEYCFDNTTCSSVPKCKYNETNNVECKCNQETCTAASGLFCNNAGACTFPPCNPTDNGNRCQCAANLVCQPSCENNNACNVDCNNATSTHDETCSYKPCVSGQANALKCTCYDSVNGVDSQDCEPEQYCNLMSNNGTCTYKRCAHQLGLIPNEIKCKCGDGDVLCNANQLCYKGTCRQKEERGMYGYKSVTTGTCENIGFRTVTSTKVCQNYARLKNRSYSDTSDTDSLSIMNQSGTLYGQTHIANLYGVDPFSERCNVSKADLSTTCKCQAEIPDRDACERYAKRNNMPWGGTVNMMYPPYTSSSYGCPRGRLSDSDYFAQSPGCILINKKMQKMYTGGVPEFAHNQWDFDLYYLFTGTNRIRISSSVIVYNEYQNPTTHPGGDRKCERDPEETKVELFEMLLSKYNERAYTQCLCSDQYSNENEPVGCIDSGTEIRFNSAAASTEDCSNDKPCICTIEEPLAAPKCTHTDNVTANEKTCRCGGKLLEGGTMCTPNSGLVCDGGTSTCYASECSITERIVNGECVACPMGKLAVNSTGECVEVTSGGCSESERLTWNTGSLYSAIYSEPCAVGQRQIGKPSAYSRRVCEDCPRGQYQDEIGFETCKLCPSGFRGQPYNWGWIATEQNYGWKNQNNFTRNAWFSNQVGATQCDTCPVGKMNSPKTASWKSTPLPHIECIECASGKYGNLTGSDHCEGCPAGFVSTSGSNYCANCPAGWVFGNENRPCLDNRFGCGFGKFRDRTTALCEECEDGYYSDIDDALECKLCKCPKGTRNAGENGAYAGCLHKSAPPFVGKSYPGIDEAQYNCVTCEKHDNSGRPSGEAYWYQDKENRDYCLRGIDCDPPIWIIPGGSNPNQIQPNGDSFPTCPSVNETFMYKYDRHHVGCVSDHDCAHARACSEITRTCLQCTTGTCDVSIFGLGGMNKCDTFPHSACPNGRKPYEEAKSISCRNGYAFDSLTVPQNPLCNKHDENLCCSP